MKRRVFLALGTVLAISGCGGSNDSAEVRYRMTLEVATPEGVQSGSSVWSWRLSKPTAALASAYDGKFRGEAVAVDLPNGKTLFALVKGQEMLPERHLGDIARTVRGEEKKHKDRVADIRDIALRKGARAEIPCEQRTGEESATERFYPRFDCPMLVTFTDIKDPTSVQLVDADDLPASFGEGYAIRRITIEITDEPITTGIQKRLAWWAKIKNSGGNLLPFEKVTENGASRYRVVPGYDETMAEVGLSQFSTEAYK